MLDKIHKMRNRTWHYQDLMGKRHTPYHHWAENRCGNRNCRFQVLQIWRHRARLAHRRYEKFQRAGGVPAWFTADLVCIGNAEESGHNSVAGYFGFIYPPSSYHEYGYGDSWLNWPRSAQERVAWHLYGKYGWSPWSTAPGCGL